MSRLPAGPGPGWTLVSPGNSAKSVAPQGPGPGWTLVSPSASAQPNMTAPSLGNQARDILTGVGRSAQEMLKNGFAQSEEGQIANAVDPQAAQSVNNSFNNFSSPLSNYNISKALGASNNPSDVDLQNMSQNVTNYAPLAFGAAEGVGNEGLSSIASKIGELFSNPNLSSPLESPSTMKVSINPGSNNLKGQPRSVLMANTLASKDFPNFLTAEKARAQRAVAPANAYTKGENSGVNVDPFIVNNSSTPSDQDLATLLPEGYKNAVNDPNIKNALLSQWKGSIATKPTIFPSNISSQLSNDVMKLHNNFMANPQAIGSAQRLLDLRSQLGSEAAGADIDTQAGRDYRSANLDAQKITDNILNSHFAQDPTGEAQNAISNMRDIYHTSIYPMQSTPLLKAMGNGNVRQGTPNEVVSNVEKATRFGGLPIIMREGYDHPYTKAADALQSQINKENTPPGFIKKHLTKSLYTGGTLLTGAIADRLLNKKQ